MCMGLSDKWCSAQPGDYCRYPRRLGAGLCLRCMRWHMMCVLCSQIAPFTFRLLAPDSKGKDMHSAAKKRALRISAVAGSHNINCTDRRVCQNKGLDSACTHRNNDGHGGTWEVQEISQRLPSSKGVVTQHQISLKVLQVQEASWD